jgi:hypothetical protein
VNAPTASATSAKSPQLEPAPGELNACGCPKQLKPSGVLLWRKQLAQSFVECRAGFKGRDALQLECSGAERSQDQVLHFDLFGRELASTPAPTSKNALLERALGDPKTWGKPGIDPYAAKGYLELTGGGGVLWSQTHDSDEAQVVRVDPRGKHLWSRLIPGLVVFGLSDPQGGFVVAGMVADCAVPDTPGAFQERGIITRLAANGDVLWTQRQACACVVTGLLQTGPDELAAMGSTLPFDDVKNWYPEYLVETLSLDGQPLSKRTADGEMLRGCSCTFEVDVHQEEGAAPTLELVAWP